MRIYVDESGDSGVRFQRGSTPTLSVGCVIVADHVAAAECVRKYRSGRGWNETREIKWSKSNLEARTSFLKCLDRNIFTLSSLVVDKRQRAAYDQIKKEPLLHALIVALERALTLTDAFIDEIIIDQSDEYRTRQRETEAKVRKALNAHQRRVGEVRFRDSKHHEVLQVADMVAGVVRYTAENGDRQYIELIARILTEHVWP